MSGSVNLSFSERCTPPECECEDLGDIEVDFEPPRTCQLTVSAHFSGTHRAGEGGPIAAGAVVSGARVRGTIVGGITPPQGMVYELCQDSPCNQGSTDAQGALTFMVPVVGDAPSLQLDADLTIRDGDGYHYYSGSTQVVGCARGEVELEAGVELALDHARLEGLAAYVAGLGAGAGPGGSGAGPDALDVNDPLGCGCRVLGRGHGTGALALGSLLVCGLATRRRRRWG